MATLIYGQLVNGCYRLLKLIRKLTNHFTHAIWISFIIFCLLCVCCRQPEMPASVAVIKKNERATGIVIFGLTTDGNSTTERIAIRLVGPGERTAILGEFKTVKGEVVFEPLVPFTPGLPYEVLLNDSVFATFEIPEAEFDAPQLLSIYPSQDTLPENLLKIYLHFSQPMVEGRSLSYVTLIENERDTLQGTFLDLQPELWNSEGTMLTLWLDPGRIKRDLIPNKELGPPLTAGNKYTLQVSQSWNSKNGQQMLKDFSKEFVASQRDDKSPDPGRWQIGAPAAGTKQLLEIKFSESLDYSILQEGIRVINSQSEYIAGVIKVGEEERTLQFSPDTLWTAGTFYLNVEARLEDLAGNNLNRPFDSKIEETIHANEKTIFTKEFRIE